jgi:hypothetical protein
MRTTVSTFAKVSTPSDQAQAGLPPRSASPPSGGEDNRHTRCGRCKRPMDVSGGDDNSHGNVLNVDGHSLAVRAIEDLPPRVRLHAYGEPAEGGRHRLHPLTLRRRACRRLDVVARRAVRSAVRPVCSCVVS